MAILNQPLSQDDIISETINQSEMNHVYINYISASEANEANVLRCEKKKLCVRVS